MLSVPDIERSTHERKYFAIRLSRFSDTHVFVRSTTVRCHDILGKRERLYNWSLNLGCKGKRSRT